MVLFANYKTFAVAADKEGKKMKARGGERVMYTSHDPCWDAKNRFGLASELPFDFGQIAHIFSTAPAPAPAPSTQPTQTQPVAPVQQPVPLPTPVAAEELQPAVEIPDGIPAALADLMRQNNVTEDEIQLAVSLRGYFPANMPIASYPPDFIQGVLIGAWEQVFGMIKENRILPFE